MAWGPRLPLAPRAGPAPPCSSDSLTSPTLTLPVLRSGRRAPVLEQTPPPSWRLGPLWALVRLASPRRRVVGSQRPWCGELGGQLRCRGARRQGPGSQVWGQGQRRGRTRAALPRVRWRGLSSCPWAPWAWGAGPAPQSAAGAARGTPGQTPGALWQDGLSSVPSTPGPYPRPPGSRESVTPPQSVGAPWGSLSRLSCCQAPCWHVGRAHSLLPLQPSESLRLAPQWTQGQWSVKGVILAWVCRGRPDTGRAGSGPRAPGHLACAPTRSHIRTPLPWL